MTVAPRSSVTRSPAGRQAQAPVRAPAPAPDALSALQHSMGNQGIAQMLGSSAPPPPNVALSLQRTGGNRAVQRLYSAPPGTVQRLTQEEVNHSTQLSEEEKQTFAEWLSEKGEVEKDVIQHRAKAT